MESYQSILAKISIFQKKAEALRENEKKLVLVEMRKLVEMYDIQSAELFSAVKPKPPAPARRKRTVVQKLPKYRDPATGKTWNGHGKRPFWLVGDKEAYLMTEEEALLIAAKPKAKRKKAARRKTMPRATPQPLDTTTDT
jgi:DNA-binding protein H-NS